MLFAIKPVLGTVSRALYPRGVHAALVGYVIAKIRQAQDVCRADLRDFSAHFSYSNSNYFGYSKQRASHATSTSRAQTGRYRPVK